MIGQRIQNYNVEELLGEGGMGTVYRATDTLLQRNVAVKILHPHLVRDATFFERFRNEAVLSAKLSHPNVALLYNFFRERNDNFMVMEFIDGYTLEKLLKQHGALPVEWVLKILIQSLDGLHHAHEKNILHRDIKPANLMLTREGTVKLMDFGIARIVGSQRLTRADRIVGTLEYMAPELLDGSEASIQSDLYAVGVLMYELLSAKMPFEATTDSTLINQILSKKPISLRSRIPDLPKKVEEILEVLLHKKPEKRFISAADLRHVMASLVTPGKVVPQALQAKKSGPVEGIPQTTVHKKSNTGPTRLADTQLVNSQNAVGQTAAQRLAAGQGSVLDKVKVRLFSTEGIILGASVIGAIMILVGGIFFLSPPKEDKDKKQELTYTPTTQVVIPQTTKLDSTPVNQSAKSTTEEPVGREEQKQKKVTPIGTQPTEPEKKPVKKKEEEEKEKEKEKEVPKPPTTTPVNTPVETAKETPKEEPKRVSHTLSLKNITVAIALDETISSNDAGIKGKSVALRVLNDVKIDGITAIAAGARGTGVVTNARSTTDGKSFLEFKPERVMAVNGEWVPVKSPALGRSGSTIEPVIFSRGTRIMPDPKTASTILIITL